MFRRYEKFYEYIQLEVRRQPEDGDRGFLQNVGIFPPTFP
jgi:hypothetical protein